MKIEKVNDTQIRCTLTKEDLADRQLKLSELAYGTEKAKSLFREMMQQAAYEFGFEADNIPLMIEAIPLPSESIILIITKVEYPEELDSRFSQFSPPSEDDLPEEIQEYSAPVLEGAEDIMNLIKKIKNHKSEESDNKASQHLSEIQSIAETVNSGLEKLLSAVDKQIPPAETPSKETKPQTVSKLVIFNSMDEVLRVASLIGDYYHGTNDLYHNQKSGQYYLVLHKGTHTPEEFNRVCNSLSEYGKPGAYSDALVAYFNEHNRCILAKEALQILKTL